MVDFRGLRFHDRAPVYQQIAEHLKRQILLGAVQDGDPMPSRRELAAQTGINPNNGAESLPPDGGGRLCAHRRQQRQRGAPDPRAAGRHRRGTDPRPGGTVRRRSQGQPYELQKGHRPGPASFGGTTGDTAAFAWYGTPCPRGAFLQVCMYDCRSTQAAKSKRSVDP